MPCGRDAADRTRGLYPPIAATARSASFRGERHGSRHPSPVRCQSPIWSLCHHPLAGRQNANLRPRVYSPMPVTTTIFSDRAPAHGRVIDKHHQLATLAPLSLAIITRCGERLYSVRQPARPGKVSSLRTPPPLLAAPNPASIPDPRARRKAVAVAPDRSHVYLATGDAQKPCLFASDARPTNRCGHHRADPAASALAGIAFGNELRSVLCRQRHRR